MSIETWATLRLLRMMMWPRPWEVAVAKKCLEYIVNGVHHLLSEPTPIHYIGSVPDPSDQSFRKAPINTEPFKRQKPSPNVKQPPPVNSSVGREPDVVCKNGLTIRCKYCNQVNELVSFRAVGSYVKCWKCGALYSKEKVLYLAEQFPHDSNGFELDKAEQVARPTARKRVFRCSFCMKTNELDPFPSESYVTCLKCGTWFPRERAWYLADKFNPDVIALS